MNTQIPSPKEIAIRFVKHTEATDIVFALPFHTLDEADRFMKRVRVTLSRMRTYIRDQGLVVKNFRMRLISIEEQPKENRIVITLRKAEPNAQIARDVADAFSSMTDGSTMNEI